MPEIAEQISLPVVDEEDLIAVGIPDQVVHAAGGAFPEAQAQRRIDQNLGGIARRGRILRGKRHEIKGVGPQRSFEINPPRRRVSVVEVRGRAKEAVLTHLALERAGRQIGMRLARGRSAG